LHRGVKGPEPWGIGREAFLTPPPQPPGSVTEPAHLRGAHEARAQRYEPQTPLERLDIPEHGPQAALLRPGNALAGPSGMAPPAGQHASCDLGPGRFARGLAALGAKRPPHPSGPKGQGHRRHLSRQGLLGRQVARSSGLQRLGALLHGPLPSPLDPLPDRPRAHRHPPRPARQRGRSGKGHKARQGTAERLERTAGPLGGGTPRASSKGAPCGVAHPCGPRPTRRCHRRGPRRRMI
jgi:hypothetical protein